MAGPVQLAELGVVGGFGGASEMGGVSGIGRQLRAALKLRHRSGPDTCIIASMGDSCICVELVGSQPTTALSQRAVFCQSVTVLGGGVIREVASC